MQDLNDMLYFTEIVAQGGFAAAGRTLNMPKSKLSRRLAGLEERLGVRLLQRTTRKLKLTEIGETYYRHCLGLREQADAAAQAIAQVQTAPRGTLRIACPITLAQSTLSTVLPLFMAKYPQVVVDMRVSNRAVDVVEEGFDVALRVRPTPEDSATLVVKRFGYSATLLVASRQYIQPGSNVDSLQDLQKLKTVAMAATDGKSSWPLVGPAGERYTHQHQPVCVVDDLLTLKNLVVAGCGMSVIPDYMCWDDLHSGRLVEVLPGWAPPQALFHAVFPTRRGMVPAVRVFLDFLAESVAQEGQGQVRLV